MKNKFTTVIKKENLDGSYLLGIFIVSMASLLHEFTLTRILSVSLWYHFAFMIISVALLGIGVSGVALSLFPKIMQKPIDKLLTVLAIIYGASVILTFVISYYIPIDPFSLFTQKIQFVIIPIYYVLITIPFFFSGLIISVMLTKFSGEVSKLYFFDLVGAGVSVLAFTVLLPFAGGNGTIVFVAALGFLAAMVFSLRKNNTLFLVSMVLMISVFAFLIKKDDILRIRVTPNKIYANYIAERPDLNMYSGWNTISKIDVMKEEEASPDGYNVMLAIIDEGNATTNIPNVRKMPPLTKPYDASNLAFVGKDSADKVFIVGSGGGGEILVSMFHAAKKVTGVEINGLLNKIITDILAGWTGQLINNNPKVEIITDDARSVLKRSKDIYDVIISAHTISASAVSSGSMSMVENFIMTKEAVKDYLKHLDGSGTLYISRPESQLPKLITTLKEAGKELGIKNDEFNFVVFRRPATEYEVTNSYLAGVIYKKNGYDLLDMMSMRNEASALGLDIEFDPLTQQENIYSRLINSKNIELEIAKDPSVLTPATDDKPFFDDNYKFSDVTWSTIKEVFSQDDKAILALKSKPVAQITLLTMLGQVLFVSILLLIVPAIFIKGERKFKVDKKFLMFFAFIGIGYISIQIALIQKFTLFLGQPVYTMLTVISSMLIFSGIGAKYSEKFINGSKSKLYSVFLIIAIYTMFIGLVSPLMFEAFVSLSLILRITITIIMLAPLAFFMGMPFPTGISMLKNDDSRMVGISWAVNGFFSVIGTVITMILAMMFGFKIIFFIAGVFYLFALLFMTIRYKNNLVNL
jgi:MFS family permease